MRTSKAILSAIGGILCALGMQAQDERVHPYMQAIGTQFRMEKSYYVEADYLREDIMRETRVEGEGRIWMKGLKYKMSADEYTVFFDGEKQYSLNEDMEEVYVSVPDPDDATYLQAVPMSVIQSYQQDFRYQFMGEKPFMGKNRVEIQLYPLELTGPYSMLKLYVNPHNMKMEAFVLKHKEGINYTMILTKVEEEEELEDTFFRFRQSDYPHVELIELIQ